MSDSATWLDQTSPELINELKRQVAVHFGREEISALYFNSGGGCMVAAVDLSIDGRLFGRQIWLTREDEHEWLIGLYDYALDPEDEGIVLSLKGYHYPRNSELGERYGISCDNAEWVAGEVVKLLQRLGVNKLQGE